MFHEIRCTFHWSRFLSWWIKAEIVHRSFIALILGHTHTNQRENVLNSVFIIFRAFRRHRIWILPVYGSPEHNIYKYLYVCNGKWWFFYSCPFYMRRSKHECIIIVSWALITARILLDLLLLEHFSPFIIYYLWTNFEFSVNSTTERRRKKNHRTNECCFTKKK